MEQKNTTNECAIESPCEQIGLEVVGMTRDEILKTVFSASKTFQEAREFNVGYFDIKLFPKQGEAMWFRYLCIRYCTDFKFDVAVRKNWWKTEGYVVLGSFKPSPIQVYEKATFTEPTPRFIELKEKAAQKSTAQLVEDVNHKIKAVDLSQKSYILFSDLPVGQADATVWLINWAMQKDGVYAKARVSEKDNSPISSLWASSDTRRWDVIISLEHLYGDFGCFKC